MEKLTKINVDSLKNICVDGISYYHGNLDRKRLLKGHKLTGEIWLNSDKSIQTVGIFRNKKYKNSYNTKLQVNENFTGSFSLITGKSNTGKVIEKGHEVDLELMVEKFLAKNVEKEVKKEFYSTVKNIAVKTASEVEKLKLELEIKQLQLKIASLEKTI